MNHGGTETQRFHTRYFLKTGYRRFRQSHLCLLCASVSLWSILLAACSIPSLEKPECTQARESIKQFYSFHVGNDMRPSPEKLKLREKFLTKELAEKLAASTETVRDYFTASENFPKAFRVGFCESVSPDKTLFQVLLLWHETDKNIQREIKVEMVKENDKWLVNNVLDQ